MTEQNCLNSQSGKLFISPKFASRRQRERRKKGGSIVEDTWTYINDGREKEGPIKRLRDTRYDVEVEGSLLWGNS